jgi:hypothetical protein
MKTYARFLALAAVALLAAAPAAVRAQNYNYGNPTYTPTAVITTTNLTAAGDVYFQVQNTNAVSVQLTGSHGSIVAAVQGTNQGADVPNASATWTALTMMPVPSGNGVASVSGNGFWYVNASGMTRVRVHVSTMASGTLSVNVAGSIVPVGVTLLNPNTTANPTTIQDSTSTYYLPSGDAAARGIYVRETDGTNTAAVKAASTPAAATDPALVVAQSPNVVDPCASPMIAKSSAVINVTSSSTTKIVDTSGSTVIYACGFTASLAGTTPTALITSGTHTSADCDTGAAVLTGTFAPTAGSVLHVGSDAATAFKTAAGAQLCVTTGATSTLEGVLTYVQK